jgi:aminomethyltransferase
MRGRDRAALLQRLTSNDIERLKPGQGVATVLPTPIGRIIDVLIVHALEDALLVTTSPGQGPAIFTHLKKNIFFNDQVTLEPAARSHAQFALYGPDAAELLVRLAGVPLADLRLHHTSTLTIAGIALRIARRAAIGGNSFTLFIPSDGAASVRAAIEQAGAMPLSAESFDTLRIEQGLPAFGRELSQEYIPLETGLLDAVSFTKGCYVGQEIIARMESRGRLAKQLRGLRLAADAAGSAEIATPTKLLVDGKDAGDLTSVTISPRYGPIGLAYVRTAHAEPGTQIGITGSEYRGEVVELPFR